MLVARYREKQKTIELVTRNYWWLGVMKDIRKYMNGYNLCLSQISYSLVVILELSGVSETQYKDVMMIDNGKYQQE